VLSKDVPDYPKKGWIHGMKDRPDRAARLQLIESMFAGQSWRAAAAQSQLKLSRSTAYRLVQLARDEEKAASAFLDDRHGHVYKLTEPVLAWLVDVCHKDPQIPSSRIQAELKTSFGIQVSVGHINHVRAQHGVTKQKCEQAQLSVKKN
jgi:transposase